MDQLIIKDLEIYAYHGVFDAEKQLGQKFVVDVTIDYDMTQAALDHDLDSSIHYGILSEQITQWVKDSQEDLIETVALNLIQNIFNEYSIAYKVVIELKKPWAPIGLPLDTVSVKLERQRNKAWIALGSNLGNQHTMLDTARQRMNEQGLIIKQQSSEILTPAWGKTDQPDFLNQVVEVETIHTPERILQILQTIEHDCGRVREEHWGPRTLDLDILFINQECIYSEDLIVPHPYIQERTFVLKPLNEIAPHYIHPILHQSIRQLLEQLDQ